MSYKGKCVLVTGAAGFIGSHLCDGLLSAGATVIGVDNLLTGNKKNLESAVSHPEFHFIHADAINNPEAYLPKNTKLDIIFHFASPASPPLYQKYPIETYLVNSMGTHNLLQYLIAANQKARFIFASTSEIYGDPKEHPQKETYWGNANPNGIRACYDESKRYGEMVCGVHFRNFDLDTRIIRIFNTFGPRMNPEDGRVIPNFMTQVLGNQPLTIYGDGKQTRSLCYITDLVAGILAIGSSDEIKGETLNLGNPAEMTVLEIADLIKILSGISSPFVYKPLPMDDPVQRKPDITKITKVLGWEPKVTPKDGLSKTLAYFKDLASRQ